MLDELAEQDYSFFLQMAEEHDIFSDILNGDITFGGKVRSLLQRVEYDSGMLGKNDEPLDEFNNLVDIISESSRGYLYASEYKERAESLANYRTANALNTGSNLLTLVGAGLLLVPGGIVIDAILLGAGWLGSTFTDGSKRESREIRNRKNIYFGGLYDSADYLDERIWKAFVFDDFYEKPWRFERTYSSHLNENERETVDEHLKQMLESGGINMSAQELSNYLSELRDFD